MKRASEVATREHMAQPCGKKLQTTDPAKPADSVSSMVSDVLLQLSKGPPYTVTRMIPDDSGVGTPRLLREEFGRTKRQTMITTLMRIVMQKSGGDAFIEQRTRCNSSSLCMKGGPRGGYPNCGVADHEDAWGGVSVLVHADRRLDGVPEDQCECIELLPDINLGRTHAPMCTPECKDYRRRRSTEKAKETGKAKEKDE